MRGGGLIRVTKVERQSDECQYAKNMELTIVISIVKVVYRTSRYPEAARVHGFAILYDVWFVVCICVWVAHGSEGAC